MKRSVENWETQLSNIQKVQAPPFLFTRITQKIVRENQVFSSPWAWTLSATLALLMLFNLVVITKYFQPKHEAEIVAGQFFQTNNFY